MIIGVQNQFIFDLVAESGTSLIDVNSLVSFTSIESCDLLLPLFKVSFLLKDNKQLPYLNEGAKLKVAFGKDVNTTNYINLQINKILESTTEANLILIEATLYKPTYSKDPKVTVFKNKTSVEVIKNVVSPYFNVVSNIDFSADRRDWFQFGISDKTFVEYLWLNSTLNNGFLGIGVSSLDNIFIVKDLVKVCSSSSYDFRASYTSEKPNEIRITSILGTQGNYAFYNTWKAYPRYSMNYNVLTDSFDDLDFKINNLLSTTNKTGVNKNVTSYISDITMYSDSNLSFAKEYNLFALSSYSKYSIELQCVGDFIPVKLLDKVFLDLDRNDPDNKEYFSGNYLVCKVVRNVSDNKILTKISLCRESPGIIQGQDTL